MLRNLRSVISCKVQLAHFSQGLYLGVKRQGGRLGRQLSRGRAGALTDRLHLDAQGLHSLNDLSVRMGL